MIPDMSGQTPALRPSEVFAERLKDARDRKNWSQADLAAALREVGHPLSRTVISELEQPSTSRSQRVTLNDVMAIAYKRGRRSGPPRSPSSCRSGP